MNFGVSRFRSLLTISCASFLAENAMDFIDLAIAGNIVGEVGLAGVELFGTMTELLFFICAIVANGTANFYAEAAGHFDTRAMSRWFSNGLIVALGAGLITALIFFLVREPYMAFVHVNVQTRAAAVPYWNWYLVQTFLQPLAVYLATLVYSDGDSKVCTAAFSAELLVNAIASYFLCKQWGTAGCALGTAVGSLACIATLACHFRRVKNTLAFTPYFSWRDTWHTLKADFSESACTLYLAAIYALLNVVLVRWFGDGALVVMAVVISVNGFVLFLDGVPSAARPIIGVYFGEGNFPAVRHLAKVGVVWALMLSGAAGVFLLCFPNLPGMLLGVDDPKIAAECVVAVRIMVIAIVFYGPSSFLVSYYVFIERTRVAFALSFMTQLLLPALGILIGGKLGGLAGLWLGFAAATPLALIFLFGGILVCARKEARGMPPFLLPHNRDTSIFNRSFFLSPTEICKVSAEVTSWLNLAIKDESKKLILPLTIEEIFMAVLQVNGARKVRAEVTVDVHEGMCLITRDDGVCCPLKRLLDTGDSVCKNVLKAVTSDFKDKARVSAAGFNRNMFKV